MTYARARLLLGTSCVGTIVVLCALSLWLGLPQEYFSPSPQSLKDTVTGLLPFFLLVNLILFPFELLGGLILPKQFARIDLTLTQFLGTLSRAAVIHLGFSLSLAALVIFTANSFSPLFGFFVLVAALLLLIILQGPLAFFIKPPKALEPIKNQQLPDIINVDMIGESYTGGVAGFPGFENIYSPKNWQKDLSEQGWTEQIKRKQLLILKGLRTKGVLAATLFVTTGIIISLAPSGSSLLTVAGLVNMTLWFTLWSFIGLLILPKLSREAVFAADKLEPILDQKEFIKTLNKLEELQDGEPNRTVAIESVFHPVPSVTRRQQNLEANQTNPSPIVLWNLARMSIFLSWVGFNPLSRAVHCNCGRPHLWVFLPTD